MYNFILARDLDFRINSEKIFSLFNDIRLNPTLFINIIDDYLTYLTNSLSQDYREKMNMKEDMNNSIGQGASSISLNTNTNTTMKSKKTIQTGPKKISLIKNPSKVNNRYDDEEDKQISSHDLVLIEDINKVQELKNYLISVSSNNKSKSGLILWSEKIYCNLNELIYSEVIKIKAKLTKSKLKQICDAAEKLLVNYNVKMFVSEGKMTPENILVNIFIENKESLNELLLEKFEQGICIVLNIDEYDTTFSFLILINKNPKFKQAKQPTTSNSKILNVMSRTDSAKSSPFDFPNMSKTQPKPQNKNKIKTLNSDEKAFENYKYDIMNIQDKIEINFDKDISTEPPQHFKSDSKSEVLYRNTHKDGVGNLFIKNTLMESVEELSQFKQEKVEYSLNNPIFDGIEYKEDIAESQIFKNGNVLTALFILNSGEMKQEIFKIN